MNNKEMMAYDIMVETGLATAEELNLARNLVSGSWMEVINAVVYVRTAYTDFDSWYFSDEE